ncbi:MAG: nitroreductase family deazaflavin-dependent oxidoreductase, partial [Acidimicrobiia bacterium]
IMKGFSVFNTALYQRSGGRFGGRFRKAPILLLTTTGRRSGRPRTTPLLYLDDDGRTVIVASYGGDDRAPQWFRNLTADPEVTIQIGGRTRRMRAQVAEPDEKARLWPRLVEMYGDYAAYQQQTSRDIPLVILTES